MMPFGFRASTSLSGAVQGSTTEKTLNSRMRRAMSWVYCDPKSRMTMVEVDAASAAIWESTNLFYDVRHRRPRTLGLGRVFVPRILDARQHAGAGQNQNQRKDPMLRNMRQ